MQLLSVILFIHLFIFIDLFLFIYHFWSGCNYNFKVWEISTRLCHNARNFLRHKWNVRKYPKLCFRFYCLKIIGGKNSLSLSKLLICYERNFHQKVPLNFEDEAWSHFPFPQITFRTGFWYANVYTYSSAMLMRTSHNTWSGVSLLQVSTFYHNSTISPRRKNESW